MDETDIDPGRRCPAWLWRGGLVLSLILLGAGLFVGRRLLADPRVVLLTSQDGADWLRVDEPFDTGAKFGTSTATVFETPALIPAQFAGASLQVTALRRVKFRVDGKLLFDSGPQLENWKSTYKILLPADLPAGEHRLQFVVFNEGGPSMLRVFCDELNIRSDDRWLASRDGMNWKAAVPADRPWDPRVPPALGSTTRDLARLSPFLILIFAIGAAAFSRRPGRANWGRRVRWLLLFGWSVLALNNMMKVPLEVGFDADEHMRYIQYVADHFSLPRPDAGWQFFQAPLYYILSALLERLLLAIGVAGSAVPNLLRLIPLACGGVMIEICYRAARMVFPDRSDLQAIATTVGGLLPMNIYMSQVVSNEPMAAVMSGLIALTAIHFLVSPRAIESARFLVIAGVIIGLALLTKVSTVIWGLPLGVVMVVLLCRAPLVQWLRVIGWLGGSVLAVTGWFLIRNFLLIGRPFYLESSLASSQWWQDPGYRTPRMFFEFGHVFQRPIYNGLSSIWDSLYGSMWGSGILAAQPPWNFGLMSCGLWLALAPMLAVAIGIWQAFSKRNTSLVFAALAIGCFIPAILYIYLTLPIYSCGKASYMLGTTPCIGLLAAAGFGRLMTRRTWRAVAGGVLVCWAVTAYLTYFVV